MAATYRPYVGSHTSDRMCYFLEEIIFPECSVQISVELIRDGEYVVQEEHMIAPPVPDLPGFTAVIWHHARHRGMQRDVMAPRSRQVTAGKNLGRSNATNCLTQAMREADSDYLDCKKKAEACWGPRGLTSMMVAN